MTTTKRLDSVTGQRYERLQQSTSAGATSGPREAKQPLQGQEWQTTSGAGGYFCPRQVEQATIEPIWECECNMPVAMNSNVRAYMQRIGRKGGSRRTPAQVQATLAMRQRERRVEASFAARCRKAGIGRTTILERLRRGWSLKRALRTPVSK